MDERVSGICAEYVNIETRAALICFIPRDIYGLQMLLTFRTFVIGLGGSMYGARIKYRQIVYQLQSKDVR